MDFSRSPLLYKGIGCYLYNIFTQILMLVRLAPAGLRVNLKAPVWTGWIFSPWHCSPSFLPGSFFAVTPHAACPLRCAPLVAASSFSDKHRAAGSFPATCPLCFILFGAIVILWGAKLATVCILHSDVGFRSQLRMRSFIPLLSIGHSLFLDLGLLVASHREHWFVFAVMPFPASPCIKDDSCSQSLSSIPLVRHRDRQSLERSVSWVLLAADATGGRRGCPGWTRLPPDGHRLSSWPSAAKEGSSGREWDQMVLTTWFVHRNYTEDSYCTISS